VNTARKVYLTVAVVAAAILLALWLQPRIARELAPRPTAAYVAIEPEPGASAVVGPVELAAGQPFRLHAVLEAVGRDGAPFYYTEASGLLIGGREVAPERLLRWDCGSEQVRLLWFTVEPWARFLALDARHGLDQVSYQEFFHPEWPMQWAVEGRLEARSDDQVDTPEAGRRFGTQRYQVWIELHADERSLVPTARFRSWGVAELETRAAEFPTVSALLAGPAAVPSAMFGLTGVAPPADAPTELLDEIARRTELRLLWSNVWLLREILRSTGSDLQGLAWRRIELQSGPRWTEEVATGDLLRVGARWVLAYRDFDGDGALGPADLCLDFERGAAVRRLSDVFVGEGEIEWARLAT
jgi:hypothetical protein